MVVLIFGFVFPKVADYSEVWATVRAMTGLELAGLVPVGLWNLASYWPLLVAVLPGLLMREAALSNLGSTAVANTVPGGAALGIGVTLSMLRSWGIPVPAIVLASVVSGVWNNFVKLGLPILALALLALTGSPGAGLTSAAVIGLLVLVAAIVIFALLLRSEALARRIGSLASAVAGFAMRPGAARPPAPVGRAGRRLPRADHRPPDRPLVLDHADDGHQPPVAVPGAAGGAAQRRHLRGRGEHRQGAGRASPSCACCRPSRSRRAASAWWSWA